MLNTIVKQVKKFREAIYQFFPSRKDAAMELVDSISSNTQADSVAELSLNPLHRRTYCSDTRVISEYYGGMSEKERIVQENKLTEVLSTCCPKLDKRAYHLFAVDCTPQPRLFSKRLADRSPVHAPNAVLGNKPITIGHQYSVCVYLPEKNSMPSRPWVIPLACKRVKTTKNGTNIGMKQIGNCISQELFKEKLCVSVADCAYSGSSSLDEVYKNPNHVHVSRLRNNRVLNDSPKKIKKRSKGRPTEYGEKFELRASHHRKADEKISFERTSNKGKKQTVRIECWNNILMRGSKGSNSSKKPFNIFRVRIYNQSGKLLYKRPMWLMSAGVRRGELSPRDVYDIYRQRFDIEHFFKFGKNHLLMDKLQTPDVLHEEAWWQLTMPAYAQLYLTKPLACHMPTPWQKHLPEFKLNNREKSPAHVQKDFLRIIQEIGTPAQPPKPRNKCLGRKSGELQVRRKVHPVVIKRKKPPNLKKLAA